MAVGPVAEPTGEPEVAPARAKEVEDVRPDVCSVLGSLDETSRIHPPQSRRTMETGGRALEGRIDTLNGLGLRRRLPRWFDPASGNTVVIGLDHGLQSGVMPGIGRLDETARRCVEAGVDALLVGPRAAQWIGQSLLNDPDQALLLRVDQTNAFGASRPAGVYGTLVVDAEDAVRVGADAVVVFYASEGAGTAEERDCVTRVARVASRAHELGIPLVVEAIVLGGVGETCKDPRAVARVARVGFELGADVLKIDYPSDEAALKEIVEGVDVPVLIRGGPRTDDFGGLLASIERAMEFGVRGVVLGRSVWQGGDPEPAVKKLTRVVHGRC